MTKTKKQEVIAELSESLKDANAVIMCDYKGLSVSVLEELRASARAKDVKVQVVKNTLATIALKNNNLEGVEIKDANIFIWGEDAIATAKTVADFSKTNKTFAIRSAYIDGESADAAKVDAFAKLPGREELLGMLASVWMAPVRNFTIGLDALRIQKEEA
ncbi:MAG: 50S ribosomal protein L10 [Campylobacterota bacterium]|nr:50S ribosomal protein L10 [Campylobacterota bacterium]